MPSLRVHYMPPGEKNPLCGVKDVHHTTHRLIKVTCRSCIRVLVRSDVLAGLEPMPDTIGNPRGEKSRS